MPCPCFVVPRRSVFVSFPYLFGQPCGVGGQRYILARCGRSSPPYIRHRVNSLMTKRNRRVAAGIALALLTAIPAAAQKGQNATAVQAPAVTDTGSLAGPRQPIFFRHDIHAGQFRIPCLYWHATVTVSS